MPTSAPTRSAAHGLTWIADACVPVHVLREIAGHDTLTTTQRYLHPDATTISNAFDALSRYLSMARRPSTEEEEQAG